jgi:hypothetical protein
MWIGFRVHQHHHADFDEPIIIQRRERDLQNLVADFTYCTGYGAIDAPPHRVV